MKKRKNISGISKNLADSIKDEKIPVKWQDLILNKKNIAVSVSESEDLERKGLSMLQLTDASIEIARYLLVNGAKILYGGDLRNGGYTEIFRDLSYQYRHIGDKEFKFINYFPFPISKSITLEVKADFITNQVKPEILEIPRKLCEIDTNKEYKPYHNVIDRYILSECLTDMRIKMAKVCDARILLGGKQKGFLGYYPGIAEEAYHTLNANKPIYIIGGYGGAANSVAEVIQGKVPMQMTNTFQFDTDFLKEFKTFVSEKSTIDLDYDYFVSFFQKFSLSKLSEMNGLSEEENKILFESSNIHEIVFLLIKGLKNIKN